MKKSEIVVGGKYLFNPKGKNRYDAFNPWDWEGIIEVEVLKEWHDGDIEVKAENCEQTIHWSELKPLKTS